MQALKKQDSNIGLAMFSVPRGNIADSTWNAIKVSVLGNSNLVKHGDIVMALGSMFGYSDGMSYGLISSTDYKTAFSTVNVMCLRLISCQRRRVQAYCLI